MFLWYDKNVEKFRTFLFDFSTIKCFTLKVMAAVNELRCMSFVGLRNACLPISFVSYLPFGSFIISKVFCELPKRDG